MAHQACGEGRHHLVADLDSFHLAADLADESRERMADDEAGAGWLVIAAEGVEFTGSAVRPCQPPRRPVGQCRSPQRQFIRTTYEPQSAVACTLTMMSLGSRTRWRPESVSPRPVMTDARRQRVLRFDILDGIGRSTTDTFFRSIEHDGLHVGGSHGICGGCWVREDGHVRRETRGEGDAKRKGVE